MRQAPGLAKLSAASSMQPLYRSTKPRNVWAIVDAEKPVKSRRTGAPRKNSSRARSHSSRLPTKASAIASWRWVKAHSSSSPLSRGRFSELLAHSRENVRLAGESGDEELCALTHLQLAIADAFVGNLDECERALDGSSAVPPFDAT